MSVTGGLKASATDPAATLPRRTFDNIVQAWALLTRAPRTQTRPAWRAPGRVAAGAVAALACVVLAMVFVDAPLIDWARGLPEQVSHPFYYVTDFGKSSWFLVPIGLLLVLVAAFATPTLPRPALSLIASITIRLEFLFMAIALPGLFATIIKRIIGRARPLVGGDNDPFRYLQFVWRPDYASLPSGHATNAFAAAVAIGLLWPRLRAPMWAYAIIIAVSRVVVLAHHPSDVIAGAVVGVVGALMVRDAFAARRLGFTIGPDGGVRSFRGRHSGASKGLPAGWSPHKKLARMRDAPPRELVRTKS